MDLEELGRIVSRSSALRARVRLQPAGGVGDVVYPPTYGDGSTRHDRRINGETIPCVLLDSVASQANRIEQTLRKDPHDLAHIATQVEGHRITCMDAPHRLCDAIFRGCSLDGEPYLKSPLGQALKSHDLPQLLGYSPTSLLFGFWHSNRVGGVGLRVARSISSEIVAVNAVTAPHTASRIDPLPISAASKVERVKDAEKVESSGWDWRFGGKLKPSEVMLGNVTPSVQNERGITMDYADQTVVISLASLRSLELGEHSGTAQSLLASIGMAGFVLAFGNGFRLRSRADFAPETEVEWESVRGPVVESLGSLSTDEASQLLSSAVEAYKATGAPWHGVTHLDPSEDLLNLVGEGLANLGST